LLRQLFNIRQSGTVTEYVEKFSELVDQLIPYVHSTDPLYFAMCFIDGLMYDIKSIVLVQRPKDLDTAYSLALLQEDVSTPYQYNNNNNKYDHGPNQKLSFRAPLPLPPPPRIDKQPIPVLPEEQRLCDGKSLEEKWSALKAYRRARGFSVKCAKKWNRDHRCARAVQLHALQEVLELFSLKIKMILHLCILEHSCVQFSLLMLSVVLKAPRQ
jgi:hypothetical protein